MRTAIDERPKTIGKEIPLERFLVDFPRGTRVADYVGRGHYTVQH